MAQIPHERTKAGRALLALKREIDKWIEKHRGNIPQAHIDMADRMQCEVFEAAHKTPKE